MFWQLAQRGVENPNEYLNCHYTAYQSPHWTEQELNNIKTLLPSLTFSQEYLAEFLDNNAGVFQGVGNNIRDIELIHTLIAGHRYVIGIDLAKHTDFTVIVVVDQDSKQVVSFERFNQIDWVYQKKKIVDIWERFNKPYIIIDSTGIGDPIYDDLQRVMDDKIQGYKITSTSKKELIEGLSLAIQNGQIFYPDIPELISELEMYEYDVKASGAVTYSAPDSFHDDCVIAIALAWQGIKPDNTGFGFVFM
jgi:hypothetical protein